MISSKKVHFIDNLCLKNIARKVGSILNSIDPRIMINFLFYRRFKKFPNLKNPCTYNEKIQWIKLNYHDPLMIECADKYKVRGYVSRMGLSNILIPIIGIYNDIKEIDFSEIGSSFILKCNHGSGYNIICKDIDNFDIKQAKRKLNKWMSEDYGLISGESYYSRIPRKILCEKLLSDPDNPNLIDYKFFCFSGKPYCVFVNTDRETTVKSDFYDLGWNKMSMEWLYPTSNYILEKPQGFNQMIEIASLLSGSFPHVRVDLYNVRGAIYFGEMTFCHGNGYGPFKPFTEDINLGNLIKLPQNRGL